MRPTIDDLLRFVIIGSMDYQGEGLCLQKLFDKNHYSGKKIKPLVT